MAKKTQRRRPASPTAPQTESPGSHLLDDGTLTVRIKDGEHAGAVYKLDLMAAKVACEAVEKKHNVGQQDFTVTPSLLVDLAAAFKSLPGVEYCTATMAFRLWQLVNQGYLDLKKGMSSTLN